MKKRIYFLLVLILTASFVNAQNEATAPENSKLHELTLNIGFNQGYLKDLQLSKFHYQQSGLVYGSAYTKRKSKSIFNVRLDYHTIDAKTDASKFFTLTENSVGNLSVEYLRKFKASTKWSFYLGPQYKTNFTYFNWAGQDAFTFLINHSLGAVLHADYNLSEKHSFHSTLSLPIFNLLVRPPWAGYDYELELNLNRTLPLKLITNGDFTSMNRYRAIDWYFNYRNQLNDKWALNVQYRFQYQLMTGERQVNFMQNQYSVGLIKTL